MSNKQNYPFQYDSVYHTQGPKPRHRYPLKDMDEDFNSIQIPPAIKFSNKHKLSLHLSQSSNEKQFLSYNKSQLALSIKQKYRAMHINSIHGLIGSTREKKQQIEDLLKKQQEKAYYQDLDQNQISASLRKLKKVVRLMEIVCKIILGKNEQNNYIDLSSQQDIIIQDMHSISMENFQKQMHSKDREIERLKKLVNILSIPDQNKSSHRQSSCKDSFTVNNSINSEKQAQIEYFMKQQINQKVFISVDVQTDIEKKQQISMEIQTQPQEQLMRVDSSVQYDKQQPLTNKIINSITQTQLEISASILNLQVQQQRKQKKLTIVQEFSIWNILDANIKNSESDQEDQIQLKNPLQIIESTLKQQFQYQKLLNKRVQNQSFFVQTEASLSYMRQFSTQTQNDIKLARSISYEIKIDSKSPFLKRYKSIVKVAISCLNLCNNVFVRAYQREQNGQIHGQIQKISQHFNKEYHLLEGRYNDEFCKEVREQMNVIYDKIYKIYQETKKNPLFLQQLQ